MSFTEAADDAQPQEGQGAEATGNPAYAEYLTQIPEEARGPAEEAFKAWDANYTRHQQEAAEYRRGWEPYENLGINQMSPEDLQWNLQVGQAARENPQALLEWIAQNHPGALPQQPEPAPEQQDVFGFQDPNAQLEQRLAALQKQNEQFAQWREQVDQREQQREQLAHEAQIGQALQAEVAELKKEHGGHLPEKVQEKFEDLIERFAMPYAQPGADPKRVIQQAWSDMSSAFNDIEKGALQGKVNNPAPAEGGGVPDVNPEKIRTLKDAAPVALEALKEMNRARG